MDFAWRTDNAKNDLSHKSFIELCHRVLLRAEYRMEPPTKQNVGEPGNQWRRTHCRYGLFPYLRFIRHMGRLSAHSKAGKSVQGMRVEVLSTVLRSDPRLYIWALTIKSICELSGNMASRLIENLQSCETPGFVHHQTGR